MISSKKSYHEWCNYAANLKEVFNDKYFCESFYFFVLYFYFSFNLNFAVDILFRSTVKLIFKAMEWPQIFTMIMVVEIVLSLVSFLGNAMILIIFLSDLKLRVRRNFYLISLTIANIFSTIFGVPLSIMVSKTHELMKRSYEKLSEIAPELGSSDRVNFRM